LPESLWSALKRRRVVRASAAYVAIALAGLEAAELILPRVGLPDRVLTVLVVATILGFPLTIGLSWAFDLTASGLVRGSSPSGDEAESDPRRTALGRRFRLVALLAATVLFTAVAVRWVPSVPSIRAVDVREDALVVLPFDVRGDPEIAYLRDGLVDLLTTQLDGVGGLRVVDPHATFALLRGGDAGSRSGPEARAIAAQLGAGRAILGSVVQAGSSLQLRASAYGPGEADPVEMVVEGSRDDLLALVDELAAGLAAGGLVRDDARLAGLEGLTTRSGEALRLYLEGVQRFRTGVGGADNFEPLARAVTLDSTFALAAYWAGHVAEYYERADPLPYFQRAARHAARLGRRDRVRVAAALAGAEGRHGDAIRLYGALVERYTDDVDGWLQLAEQLAHAGRFTGRTLAEARPAYERAIALDPALAPAYYHLAHIGALQGDTTALAVWSARMDSAGIDSLFIACADLVRGLIVGDDVLARAALARFAVGEGAEIPAASISGSVGELLGATLDHAPERSRAFMQAWTDRLLTDTARTVAARRTARIEAGSARFRRAEEALRRASASLGTVLAQDLAWLALHPAAPVGERTRAAARALAAARPDAGTGEAAARHYLLGRLALRSGDTDSFRSARSALHDFDGRDPESRRFAADLALELDAEAALADGDPRRGLEILLGASYWNRGPPWPAFPADSYLDGALPDRAPMFLRARLLRGAGRDSAAAHWFGIAAEGIWYRAPALLELAALQSGRGDEAGAEALRRRARRLWSQADPAAAGLSGTWPLP
jgi:hypothetical protein